MSQPDWPGLLTSLGLAIRRRLRDSFADASLDPARMVAREGGDEIFAIDRCVEPVIEAAIESWPAETKPLLLIVEGMGEDGRLRIGDAGRPPRNTLIIDPIDGTRAIMYQKRSAWFIAGVAGARPDRTEPTLRDIEVSLLLELPTQKQTLADHYIAVRGSGVEAWRTELDGSVPRPIVARPSGAASLLHGYAHVANFFPGVKRLAADLMERIVDATLPERLESHALLYDDQYPSTAAQMVELIRGSDRFTCDLRPLFNRILSRDNPEYLPAHTCHPYDFAGALIAEQSGVIVTDGFGAPIDGPLDVHTPLHWCGYANGALRQRIEPVIHTWLAENGIAG